MRGNFCYCLALERVPHSSECVNYSFKFLVSVCSFHIINCCSLFFLESIWTTLNRFAPERIRWNNRFAFRQLVSKIEMLILEATRKSAELVLNIHNGFLHRVPLHCRILHLGDHSIRHLVLDRGIGCARKQSATHRSPAENSIGFGGNSFGAEIMQKLEGGKLSESVLSIVTLRDTSAHVSWWEIG